MVGVIRSPDRQLKGGFGAYISRRIRRIIPPYYAALAISLLLFAVIPGLNHLTGWRGETESPAFNLGAIASHLLLVHNFTPWMFTINSPMWSIATEWQIYFFFPLLLLPVWRRWGNIAVVVVGLGVGLVPPFFLHSLNVMACSWYLGLFAMGMVGAAISFSSGEIYARARSKMPWAFFMLIFGIGLAAIIKLAPTNEIVKDLFAGAAATCLLIYCAQCLEQTPKAIVLRLFHARWLVFIGTFSYSLYLMHSPILSLFHLFLRSQHLSTLKQFILLPVLGLPLILVLTYLFHLAFERQVRTRKSAS